MRQHRKTFRWCACFGLCLLAVTGGLGTMPAHATLAVDSIAGSDDLGAAWFTRGRDIVNLSSHTLKFTGWNPTRDAPDGHPPIGALLHPGQTHHYEIEWAPFGDVYVEPQYSYIEPDRRDAPSLIDFRLSSKGQQICTPSFFSLFNCAESPSGVSGAVIMDRSGSDRVVANAGAQWQEAMLKMCSDDKSRCRFDVKSSEDIRSKEEGVGTPVKNMTGKPMPPQSISLTSTVSTTWTLGATVKASLLGVEITGNVSYADTKTKTFTQSLNFHVDPYSVAYFTVSHPLRRLHGDATITMPNNSTLHLENVVIDTPGPGPSEYKFWQETWHTPGGLGSPAPTEDIDLGTNIIGPPIPGLPPLPPQPDTSPRPATDMASTAATA